MIKILIVVLAVFFLLTLWARRVINHLGTTVDAFIIYIVPAIVISSLVTFTIMYLSPNN